MRLTPGRRDRGSVLMLMPAGVLVVLVLAAIAVDLSLVFLRQRQASATAADIANDLVTAALDVDHLRATGEYRVDEPTAWSVAEDLVTSSDVADELVGLDVVVDDEDRVTVTLELRVDYLYARAIPGAADSTEVRASATASAVAG